eukprot:CAMPEP_0170514370 /NCGR_PEP_ID=MMETSP0209-20121228/932_1 /TAXON_ID=665100 ORGANISM="Litonotus pictus, Strain P1" /NCGR_SAMPLE_ID=MMETSP0209 /ASSEMBLY_ACC=CAM_ASM_000301 /LENGTH=192 /DNA_ID=CAMNT_0010798427 /DNA_START=219 /DNA_END=797 /DNA_ORIENTATION=+
MENSYKKNIPGCLVPTSKIAYKPFKVSLEGINPKTTEVQSVPFYGSTTYDNNYIDYGSSRTGKGMEPDDKEFKVAFRGKSVYSQDYRNDDPEHYLKSRGKYISYKPTLKFVGKVASATEGNQNYKPIDYNQPAYFGGDKLKKTDFYQSEQISCPFPKSNFESITKTAFVDHFQRPCKLREHFNKNNIRDLEV